MPTLALLLWPAVALVFSARAGLALGLIWSTIAGYLFLPSGFAIAIPGFVDYEKGTAIALGAALSVLIARSSHGKMSAPKSPGPVAGVVTWIAFAVIAVGLVLMWRTNTSPLVYPLTTVPAIRFYDVISMSGGLAAIFLVYLFAARYLAGPKQHRMILVALVCLGLVYSLPVLLEVRISPQLSNWVYGYFPHAWQQHIRGGGFRPIVFLDHGLSVGFFLASSVVAAVALSRRVGGAERVRWLLAALWLLAMLVLSKNYGAMFIVSALGVAMFALSARALTMAAGVIAILFLFYPAARQANLIPVNTFISVAKQVAPHKVGSFTFRIEYEDILLERALQKPLAGWGPWGRFRVRDEEGRDISVTDGLWVIVIGERGWIGYIGFFGLLTLPVIALSASALRGRRSIPYDTAGLAVIMSANFIYLVPNATLTPVGWLVAGALAGLVQSRQPATDATETETVEVPADQKKIRYTRFGAAHAKPSPSYRR